jgi:hypothetical protein
MPTDRAAWLAQAREILSGDHPAQSGELTVTIRSASGHRTELTLPADATEGQPTLGTSQLERDILDVVRAVPEWITAKAIASRLKLPCDSGFRAILRNLTEREPPPLEASKHGYRLVHA